MANRSEEVKESLLRENEEFQQLARRHQELESRLSFLSEKLLLSEEEKVEEVMLKKRKLYLKDKMADLIRRHQVKDRASAPGTRSASL